MNSKSPLAGGLAAGHPRSLAQAKCSLALAPVGTGKRLEHKFYLSGQAASQVHGARAGFVGLQPQHHCRGQLVMGSTATGLLLGEKTENIT